MAHHIPASPGPRVAGNETIARIRAVRVRRGAEPATGLVVDDVNFDLRRGERLAVTGGEASGTGALIRAIGGRPAAQEAVVDGTVDVDGTVHQLTDGIVPSLSFVAVTGGADPLAAAHLERAEILRVLQARPAVIVVDQSGDLPRDLPEESNAAFLVRTFTECDTALVLVTDDLGVLRETCDTVQVLLAGRIVERGPVAEVLSRPHHRYTQMMVNDDGAHAPRSGRRWGSTTDRRTGGCPFEPVCPVGHGRRDCSTTFPASRSFPSSFGSVTAKCHRPAFVSSRPVRVDSLEEESR